MRVSQFDGYDDADSPKKNKVRPYNPPDNKPRVRDPIPLHTFRKCMKSEKREDGGLVSWGFKQIYNRLYKDDGITHYNSNYVSESLKHWVKQGLIVKLESGNPQYYIKNPYNPDEHLEPSATSLSRKYFEKNIEELYKLYDKMISLKPEYKKISSNPNVYAKIETNDPKQTHEFYEIQISKIYDTVNNTFNNLLRRKEEEDEKFEEWNEQNVDELNQTISFCKDKLDSFITHMFAGRTPDEINALKLELEKPPYTFKFSPR
jgi:hypothetical protein